MTSETPAERLRTALELYGIGEGMVRSRLRREHPDAREDEIEEGVRAWLARRPGAEFGDFPGPASSRTLR